MIRLSLLSAIFLMTVSVSTPAEIKFAIGEPSAESTKSGIGQISGWAVSDTQIVSVEAFIDGVSLGVVPYGGTRMDVAAAFPEFPNSEFSGWAMKWNYSLLLEGEHIATILVTDSEGLQQSKDVVFRTTGFKSEFIADPQNVKTSGAVATTPENGRIVITGAEVEGETVDIELLWDTASQQFLINKILREQPPLENLRPTADAGPSFNADTGEFVVVEGNGYDPDGRIVDYSWVQLSGPVVSLIDADQRVVKFTAPGQAGSIRLQLTVRDDNGGSDTDETVINVLAPLPANQPPQANAGPNRTVQSGETVDITATASDSDGAIVSWLWEQLSGSAVSLLNTNSPTVRFTAPDNAGTIQLRLTVSDDDGATGSDDVTVTVEEPAPPPNQAPTANAGADLKVQQGEIVTLTGSGSDSDGTVSAWLWKQVSGPAASLNGANSQQVQFTAPESPGDILLRLTVTDDDGATGFDDVIITVEELADPDTTTGETLASMLPYINAARGQPQTCGGTDYPAQPPLTWSSSLATIARLHSMDMARQGYFSHTSLDGTSMSARVFPYWSGSRVGENIAAATSDYSDSYVVELWLTSSGHCSLIMDPNFTHVGAGSGHNPANGFSYGHFWTLDFGG